MENRRPSEITTSNIGGAGDVGEGVVEVLPEHREVDIRALSPTEHLSGDEKGEVSMANFLGADSGNPKYEKILKDVDNIVHKSDANTLVDLVKSNLIHPTVLLRLFERYAERKDFTDNFTKLTDALTELEMLSYDLSEEVTGENPARYYSVLKKVELILQDKIKRKHADKTDEELLGAIKQSNLSKAEVNDLSAEAFLRSQGEKSKTAEGIIEMVHQGKLHKSVLEHLAKEYMAGRAVPGGIKSKIEDVFTVLRIKHETLN